MRLKMNIFDIRYNIIFLIISNFNTKKFGYIIKKFLSNTQTKIQFIVVHRFLSLGTEMYTYRILNKFESSFSERSFD